MTLTKILITALPISAFLLVVAMDLYIKATREPASLPHRQPHVCAAGDTEAEEAGTRLVEWLYEAKRQAKINDWERDALKGNE